MCSVSLPPCSGIGSFSTLTRMRTGKPPKPCSPRLFAASPRTQPLRFASMPTAPLLEREFLEKLERLTIQWQRSFPGVVGGHNTSRFAGAGQEFLDHRQFHHGDDLRAVNWRAYLRLEKMFLKMFQLEPRIPVRVLVDVSRSMTTGGSKGALSKFDYARKLAAAMCYVALVRLDSIYLQPFAEKLGDPLRLGGGRQRFQPVANYLQALKPG